MNPSSFKAMHAAAGAALVISGALSFGYNAFLLPALLIGLLWITLESRLGSAGETMPGCQVFRYQFIFVGACLALSVLLSFSVSGYFSIVIIIVGADFIYYYFRGRCIMAVWIRKACKGMRGTSRAKPKDSE